MHREIQPPAFWKVVAEARTSPKALQVTNKCHPKRVARDLCVGHLLFKMCLLFCLRTVTLSGFNDLKGKENGSLRRQHTLEKSRSSGSCYIFESSVGRYSWFAATGVSGLSPCLSPQRERMHLRETCSPLPRE